jgi:hypothetical protein
VLLVAGPTCKSIPASLLAKAFLTADPFFLLRFDPEGFGLFKTVAAGSFSLSASVPQLKIADRVILPAQPHTELDDAVIVLFGIFFLDPFHNFPLPPAVVLLRFSIHLMSCGLADISSMVWIDGSFDNVSAVAIGGGASGVGCGCGYNGATRGRAAALPAAAAGGSAARR